MQMYQAVNNFCSVLQTVFSFESVASTVHICWFDFARIFLAFCLFDAIANNNDNNKKCTSKSFATKPGLGVKTNIFRYVINNLESFRKNGARCAIFLSVIFVRDETPYIFYLLSLMLFPEKKRNKIVLPETIHFNLPLVYCLLNAMIWSDFFPPFSVCYLCVAVCTINSIAATGFV